MDNIFIERLWRSLKYEAIYLHEIADGFTARRLIGEWLRFYNVERPHSALDGRTPAEAYRGDPPVGMWTSRSAPCPHPHRRSSNKRKIVQKGFWRPEKQPEYTLTQPPGCPKGRGQLTPGFPVGKSDHRGDGGPVRSWKLLRWRLAKRAAQMDPPAPLTPS